jgi:hypothetical protein
LGIYGLVESLRFQFWRRWWWRRVLEWRRRRVLIIIKLFEPWHVIIIIFCFLPLGRGGLGHWAVVMFLVVIFEHDVVFLVVRFDLVVDSRLLLLEQHVLVVLMR